MPPPPSLMFLLFPTSPPATFGSRSPHLLHPMMLCSAAYAELGDGTAALHRLQAALAIAELLCVPSRAALSGFALISRDCRLAEQGLLRPLVTVLHVTSSLYAQAGMILIAMVAVMVMVT